MEKIKTGGLRRRLAIGAAGAKGGLGLLTSKASSLLLPKDQQKAHNDAAMQREAMRFVKELGELKGAYVKIGQMLALYGEHLLPKPVTDALHTLESQTTALDWSVIESALFDNLGDKFSQLVVDQQSFAAASLAQVHKARFKFDKELPNSEMQICIKVQYPGIADAIEDDFKNVMQMLALSRWLKSGQQLEMLSKELKTQLLREVDYCHELEAAETMRSNLVGDSRYLIPKYYPDFCNSQVLTMQFSYGVEVTHPSVKALSQKRRNALAIAMLELFLKEAFDWQLMQTDPNFGNYRIVIDENGDNDVIVLLDFGAVQHLDPEFSQSLKKTILASQVVDMPTIIEGAIELGCLTDDDTDIVKESFATFCCFILEPFSPNIASLPEFARTEDMLYDWQNSKLLKRAGKMGSEGMLVKGFVVPPAEFMLMVRKLTGVFTFVSSLGAQLDSADLLLSYAESGDKQ